MKDAVDHINDIYGRLSDVESRVQLHASREKYTLNADFSIITFPLFSGPDRPSFGGYPVHIEVVCSQPLVHPALFGLIVGNDDPSVSETLVWQAPLMSGRSAEWLFPTDSYGPAPTYTPSSTVLQASPLVDADAKDYVRFGVLTATDGGYCTAYIDFAQAKPV